MQLQNTYTLQANPAPGYSFTGWSSTAGTPGTPNNAFTTFMPGQTGTITATFKLASNMRLLTVNSAHGIPSPTVGITAYASGTSVTCSVKSPVTEAGINYTCVSWSGTGSAPQTGYGSSATFAITQNSTITWNWAASIADLVVLPIAGYTNNNILQEGQGLSHGDLNSVTQQTVNATTGQPISLGINYQIFSPSSASEIDQLFFVESWTPTWPPNNNYTITVYSGAPGLSPGVTNTSSISFTAPTTPGTYYLWLCIDAQNTMQAAINRKTTSMNGAKPASPGRSRRRSDDAPAAPPLVLSDAAARTAPRRRPEPRQSDDDSPVIGMGDHVPMFLRRPVKLKTSKAAG